MAGSDARPGRWIRRVLAGVLLLLGAAAVAIVIGPALIRPVGKRFPLAGTPADYGVRFETVAFAPPDQPLTLRAWWMPAVAARAAVVMVHGGGDDNRSHPYSGGLALARDLVAHRYSVLALDLRNYGESDAAPDGQVTFGDTEANDVLGALNYLGPRHPGLRYAAFGFSMGGQAALYAASRDARIEAVVTDSTFTDCRAVAVDFVHAATGLPGVLLPPLLWSAERLHGVPLERGRAIDVAGTIAPRPVLLIHNQIDPIVPVEHCRRLAAAIPSARVWITPAPPADHPLHAAQGAWGTHVQSYNLYPQAYVEHLTRFLDETFAANREGDEGS